MRLDLLQGIEHYAYKDKQRGSSVELGELVVYPEHHGKCREYRHDSQENGSGQGDTRHYCIEVVGCFLSGLHSGDESAVLLHLLSHHGGVHGYSCVEVSEGHYEEGEDEVVPESGIVAQCSRKSL